MRNLYELTNDFLKLQQLIEDGEFEEEVLADTMEALEGDIEAKAEGYATIIANLEAENAMLDNEIKRLQARKKSNLTGIDRLKGNLSAAMHATKHEKFKTEHFSFGFRKSTSVSVPDIGNLPKAYQRKKVVIEVDKKLIGDALKAGKKVRGASLQENESLQIK